LNVDVEDFRGLKENIDENYYVSDMVEEFRTDNKWKLLDSYRNFLYYIKEK